MRKYIENKCRSEKIGLWNGSCEVTFFTDILFKDLLAYGIENGKLHHRGTA